MSVSPQPACSCISCTTCTHARSLACTPLRGLQSRAGLLYASRHNMVRLWLLEVSQLHRRVERSRRPIPTNILDSMLLDVIRSDIQLGPSLDWLAIDTRENVVLRLGSPSAWECRVVNRSHGLHSCVIDESSFNLIWRDCGPPNRPVCH